MRKKNTDSNFLLDKMSVVKYDLYFRFGQEYKRVVNAYHTAFAEAQSDPEKSDNWPETYSKFLDKIAAALDNWKRYGYKHEIQAGHVGHRCYPSVPGSMVPVAFGSRYTAARH